MTLLCNACPPILSLLTDEQVSWQPCQSTHMFCSHRHINHHRATMVITCITTTAPQHLVCRAVQSLHISHMQTGIIKVFICRRLHMNTSMIPICIWLICRLCTALHTKCCGAVHHLTRHLQHHLTRHLQHHLTRHLQHHLTRHLQHHLTRHL